MRAYLETEAEEDKVKTSYPKLLFANPNAASNPVVASNLSASSLVNSRKISLFNYLKKK